MRFRNFKSFTSSRSIWKEGLFILIDAGSESLAELFIRALARGCGLGLARRCGDLGDQLAGDSLGEGAEIIDLEKKGPLPADHVLLEISGQTARRLGVKGVAGVGLGVDDRQPVDRDTGSDRLVARFGDGAAGIVGA